MIINIPPYPYFIELYKTNRRIVLLYIFSIAWLCVNYGAIQSTLIGSMHALILFAKKMSQPSSEIITNSHDSNYLLLRNDEIHSRSEEIEDFP